MARSAPPRFVVRTTVATLIMVAGVLTAVFVGVALNVRERVRGAVADKLEAGQRMLSALEQRRARELGVQVATLAENPTLKAAVATYKLEAAQSEPALPARHDRGHRSRAREAGRANRLRRARGRPTRRARVLAVGGRRDADWPLQAQVRARQRRGRSAYVSMASGVFQFASAPLALQQHVLGTLQLAKALDSRYAQELSTLSGAATLIAAGDNVIATTLPADLAQTLDAGRSFARCRQSSIVARRRGVRRQAALPGRRSQGLRARLDRRLDARADAGGAARAWSSSRSGRLPLAAFASVWLARTISRPIDTLSTSLSEMTASRDFDHPVRPTGF